MEFDNSFDVPLPPAQAWPILMDVKRMAPCMPGAQLTELVDDKTFKGKVSVRLGPVSLTFAGTAQFEDVDATGFKARIKANGSDAKGRGGAHATVGFSLQPSEAGSKVLVHTDLTLSGSVAQYGRGVGMIQDVANQIIKQFAQALKAEIGKTDAVAAPAAMSAGAAPVAPPAPSATLAPSPPPTPAAKPISGFSLLLRALWGALVRTLSGQSRPS